jgi:gliding motility-associated-like protein
MKLFAFVFLVLFNLCFYSSLKSQNCINHIDAQRWCIEAPLICDLDRACDTLLDLQPLSVDIIVCLTQQVQLFNSHYFRFIASAEIVEITINPFKCKNNGGMGGAILSQCPAGIPPQGGRSVGDCITNCTTDPYVLGVNGKFIVGQEYYVLLFGCAGDICEYYLSDVIGVDNPVLEIPTTISGPSEICPGGTIKIKANNPFYARSFFWNLPDGSKRETEGPELTITIPPDASGPYTICLEEALNDCYSLTNDYGYEGDVCFTVIVREPDIVTLPSVDFCDIGFPYQLPGYNFYPPSGIKTATYRTASGCDSIVQVYINFIRHEPEPNLYIVCQDDFPIVHPDIGFVFGPGSFPIAATDEYGCDSTYVEQVLGLDFTFNVIIDRYVLECPGDGISIDASNVLPRLSNGLVIYDDITYEWFKDEEPLGIGGPYLFVTQAGRYQMNVTVQSGLANCTKSFEFVIRENFVRPEVPVITGDSIGCIGNVLQFTIGNYNGSSIINWLDGPGYEIIGNKRNRTVRIELTDPGADTLCVRLNKPNCDSLYVIGCFPIVVTDGLTPEFSGDTTLCSGRPGVLALDRVYNTYLWSDGSSGSSLSVTTPGIYSVTVEDQGGCEGIAEIEVESLPDPIPVISGPTAFCEGLFAILGTIESYESYLWTGGSTDPQLQVNQAGTYRVTITDSNGCRGEAEISVRVDDELEPQVNGNRAICSGAQTILDAGSNYADYQWSTGALSSTITVNAAGTYLLTVTDVSGCTGSTSVVVQTSDNPVVVVNAPRDYLCPGDQLSVQANPAGMNYRWDNGSTGQMRNISAAGTYLVTVTDNNGCSGTGAIQISQRNAPQPSIDGNLAYCEGESTSLSVSGTFSDITWSNGSGGNSTTVSVPGSIVVTVTDQFGCSGSSGVTVTERDSPEPTIIGDLKFCEESSTMLEADPGYTQYIWNGNTGTSILNVTSPGVITLEVSDNFGCRGTTSVNVIMNPNPIPSISGSTTFCTGFFTTLDAGNWASVLWSNGWTQSQIEINLPGTYTVTITDANQCTGVRSVNVTESDELDLEISGIEAFCDGEVSTLDAGPGFISYEWSTGATGNRFLDVSTAGLYSVTVTGNGGCTGSDVITIIVNDNPTPQILGPDTFCDGVSIDLNSASPYATYLWNDGSTQRVIQVNTPGIYSLTVVDGNGCIGEAFKEVFLEDYFVPEVSGDRVMCTTGSTVLTVASGYTSYIWSDGVTGSQRTILSPGTYSVIVTDTQGCKGSATVTVTAIPPPIADAGELTELSCRDQDFFELGSENTSSGNHIYQWTEIEYNRNIGNATAYRIQVNRTGTYVLKVTDLITGCSVWDTVNVVNNRNIIVDADLEVNDPLCHNDFNGEIALNGVIGGTAPYAMYLNNIRVVGDRVGDLPPASYSILLIDAKGCEWTIDTALYNPQLLTINAGDDRTIKYGDTIWTYPTVNPMGTLIENMTWYEDDQIICTFCPISLIVLRPDKSVIYRVHIINQYGCEAMDYFEVFVSRDRNVFTPGAFTPDDNGRNDFFTIFGDEDLLKINTLKIFDRWGTMLFEGKDLPPNKPSVGWDGSYQGEFLPPNTYVFVSELLFDDGKIEIVRGEVVLLR